MDVLTHRWMLTHTQQYMMVLTSFQMLVVNPLTCISVCVNTALAIYGHTLWMSVNTVPSMLLCVNIDW